MPDNDWVDEFIQEVKKLAYDIPGPNPYTPLLLSHCLEAERRLVEEHSENENAGFEAFKTLLNTYPSAITKAKRFVAQKEMGSLDPSASAKFNLHNIAFGIADETWPDGRLGP